MFDQGLPPELMLPAAVGFVVGLVLLARGLSLYRHDTRIESIATSRIASVAAGEVRLTGTVEPLVSTLVSPLQSQPCVWYRALARETGDNGRTLLREERAVEFALRDATGEIRIIPRSARWLIDDAFDETTDLLGDEPPGLHQRIGPATTMVTEPDREAAIAALLTVRQPTRSTWDDDADGGAGFGLGDLVGLGGLGYGVLERRTRYQEARIAPGDTITIMGYAQPFSDAIGRAPGGVYATIDPMDAALEADLEAARAAGTLAPSAAAAWGNAVIPGFGIGQPVEPATIDPGATPLPAADPTLAARADRLFTVPDHALVVTGGPGAPLTVYAGTPQEAEAHHDHGFALGLGGAALSACSLLIVAITTLGRP